MDKRNALPVGYRLSFPGLTCTVEEEIGRGSNAIVYKGTYADAANPDFRHQVLVKELFPYHDKGAIRRGEDGSVQCLAEGQETMALHKESFLWSSEIHLQFKKKHPADVGVNLNTYLHQGTCYTVLDFSGGRTLEKCLDAQGKPGELRQLARWCMGILESLELFHGAGFLHLDISPDNVLLLSQGSRERIELIDFNSVVRLRDLSANVPLRLSLKQGFAASEVRRQDPSQIGTWTDLYSVAAVFYRCLMGKPLSRMQLSGLSSVQAGLSPCLERAPATVKSQVQHILSKGLASSQKARFQTAEEMRTEFQELLDRIDGIGVTHWALWENGAKSVRQEICGNASLAYLTGKERLYDLQVRTPKGVEVSDLTSRRTHAVLTGSGGTGKTTLMLQMAWQESRAYRPDRTVLLYIPLYSYTAGTSHFIHDKILQKLRFPVNTDTYANARHALDLLLQKPLASRQGSRPAVCLLLDGYNEITEDTQNLKKEIRQLSEMEGVSILITSRQELPEFGFENWSLCPLDKEEIRGVLSRSGLLLPEEPQMRGLLQNAMMLSLFVRTCLNDGQQLKVTTKEELIHAYLKALVEKESASRPENAPETWQIRAAVECVLPVIAALSKQESLSNLQTAEKLAALYKHLGSRMLCRRYPHWVGHIGEIRGNTAQADDWYHLMIQDILWRLGLLTRDANGEYRIFHQEFQDVLEAEGTQLLTMLRRKKQADWLKLGLLTAGMALALYFGAFSRQQRPAYEPMKAVDILSYGLSLSNELSKQQDLVLDLMENPTPEQDVFDDDTYATLPGFDRARTELMAQMSITVANRDEKWLATLVETGERFPWNDVSADLLVLTDAAKLLRELNSRYLGYVEVLEKAYSCEEGKDYDHCRSQVEAVLETDTRVCAAYYVLTCRLPMEGLPEWETTAEGKDYLGPFQRALDSTSVHPEMEALAAQWEDAGVEEIKKFLADALDASKEVRDALSKDAVFMYYARVME